MSEKANYYPCGAGLFPGEPKNYVEWGWWADKMTKTHEQRRCHQCQIFHLWIPFVDSTPSRRRRTSAPDAPEEPGS